MISTTFHVAGVTSHGDVLRLQTKVGDGVPDVGAIAVERHSAADAQMIIKHKDDVELDRAAVDAAVQKAGFRLTG